MLGASNRGSLSGTKFGGSINIDWELHSETDNVLLHLTGATAQLFDIELKRENYKDLGNWQGAYVGLSASCKLNRRRLYINPDANTYFSRK